MLSNTKDVQKEKGKARKARKARNPMKPNETNSNAGHVSLDDGF
jgi:hypothetical protein